MKISEEWILRWPICAATPHGGRLRRRRTSRAAQAPLPSSQAHDQGWLARHGPSAARAFFDATMRHRSNARAASRSATARQSARRKTGSVTKHRAFPWLSPELCPSRRLRANAADKLLVHGSKLAP
eukprot:Amastigsp_a3934_48.p2 type:complete len:126 gc:universal Amastigsp_a3934_48:487-864(+)